MKQTFKSFTKFYFRNWASLLGVILFTIASFSVLIGLLSSPLKIKKITDDIAKNYQKWDYSISQSRNRWSYDVYLYDYLFNQKELGPGNAFDAPIIKPDAQVRNDEGEVRPWHEQFIREHQYYCKRTARNVTFTKFMDWYFNICLLNFRTYDQEKISLAVDYDDEQFWIEVQDLFTPNWLTYLKENAFRITKIMNQDLIKAFNQTTVNQLSYESNYWLNFQISNSFIAGPLNVRIDDINFQKSDNVVSNVSDERLRTMKNNEVIINSNFAYQHNLKIGDTIKIANFINYDNSPAAINQEYQIIGFGTKLTNLVATGSLTNQNAETLILYLSHSEIANYLSYISFNQNTAYTPTGILGENFFRYRLKQRLNLIRGAPIAFDELQKFLEHLSLSQAIIVEPFGEEWSLNFLKILDIQIEIMIVIALILLTFVTLFVNFFIGTKIRFLRHQIGIFKAFGYTSTMLSSIFGFLTYGTFLVCVVLGYALSLPMQIFTNHYFSQNILLRVPAINTDVFFLCLLIIIIPLTLAFIAFLSAYRKINKTTLGLIYFDADKKIKKENYHHLKPHFHQKSLNLWRMQRQFVSSAKGSHLVIVIIFLFTSLLLILEFMIPSVLDQTTEQLIFYTHPSVDHQDGLSEERRWFETEGKLDFENRQNYDLDVFNYQQNSDLVKLAQSDENELYQSIQQYLKIDRINHDPTIEIKFKLFEITELNINHQIIEIDSIVDFLQVFEEDYHLFLAGDPIFDTFYQQVNQVWLPKFLELKNYFAANQKSTCLTFNNLYVKEATDLLTLSLDLSSSVNHRFYRNEFNLELINQNASNFFKMNSVSQNQWAALNDEKNYHDFQIPVIIANQLAQKNHVKIGDELKMNIKNTQIFFTLKVVGIAQGDNQSANIYSNLSHFKNQYFNSELLNLDIYNEIYSQSRLLSTDYLTANQNQSVTFYNDFINFIFFKEEDKTIKITEFFEDPNRLKSFVNLPFGNSEFRSFYVERLVLNQVTQNITNLFAIIEYCQFIMTFVIVVYAITYLLEKRQKEILILKTFGYKNSEIIFLIFSSYLGIIWLVFFLAYGFWIGMLKVFELLIEKFTLSTINYLFPFGWGLIPGVLVLALTITVFIICLAALKRQKLQVVE